MYLSLGVCDIFIYLVKFPLSSFVPRHRFRSAGPMSASTLKCSNRNCRFVWSKSYVLVGRIHCCNLLNQNDLHKNPLLISVFIDHLGHSLPFTWCRLNARILFQLKNEHNHELKIIINNYCFHAHLHTKYIAKHVFMWNGSKQIENSVCKSIRAFNFIWERSA